jgi:Ribbon-helix-helix protein, copG family
MARQVTITLDDDLAAQLEEEARQSGASFDQAATEAVRRSLTPKKKFVVRTFDMGKPLIDLECTGRALEEQDRLDALEQARRTDMK